MISFGAALAVIQLFFAVVIGLYFWNLLRNQQGSKMAVQKESRREMDKLEKLRSISLSEPLAERTRPASLDEIVGQEDGLKGLRAALCQANPQHVIIYGPPGVGKTAAARVVLEEAKRNPAAPFRADASFVEVDATTARFDERGIADPLIGSVHDPIYQGAGAMGQAGIPQPKPGAATRAHGGVLFIDEIGELHPIQMNKLLKVLEDRKVILESAYYNPEDANLPSHIRDVFENGLPADFRLVGATTRQPYEIPSALRSRCLEIFFRPLQPDEVGAIAVRAADKIGCPLHEKALDLLKRYANNGREAVNIVQIAAGVAINEGRKEISSAIIEWVLQSGQYSPRPERKVGGQSQVGVVNGLAVSAANYGMVMEVEATARPVRGRRGEIKVTGLVDEEEIGRPGHTLRRKSMARASVENVLTVLQARLKEDLSRYDIHVNFPGGVPVDGPSAGVSIAVAVYSAVTRRSVRPDVAMTGEVTIRGRVRAVGGIVAKVAAARHAGCKKVLIPEENERSLFEAEEGIEVIGVRTLDEALQHALSKPVAEAEESPAMPEADLLTATPL